MSAKLATPEMVPRMDSVADYRGWANPKAGDVYWSSVVPMVLRMFEVRLLHQVSERDVKLSCVDDDMPPDFRYWEVPEFRPMQITYRFGNRDGADYEWRLELGWFGPSMAVMATYSDQGTQGPAELFIYNGASDVFDEG